MPVASPLRLRWIWGTVYAIAGALALVHLLFLWLDRLPSGVFYAGYGIACFVGAALATRQSRDSTLTESTLAALLIGLLHLAVVLLDAPLGALEVLDRISAPLSTTFLCIAGAVAGGRLGYRWHRLAPGIGAERLRLAVTAALVLVGATATHTVLIMLLGHLSEWLATITAIVFFFATPALAGASLQLTTRRKVESSFCWAAAFLTLSTLLAVTVKAEASAGMIVCLAMVLGLAAALGFVLMLPGTNLIRGSKQWKTPGGARVPTAVVHAGSLGESSLDAQRAGHV